MSNTEILPKLTIIDIGPGSVGYVAAKTTDKKTDCSDKHVESQNQALAEFYPTPAALSEALVSMMTVTDEKRMWRDFVLGSEMQRRGVRFLPRQALKRALRKNRVAGI